MFSFRVMLGYFCLDVISDEVPATKFIKKIFLGSNKKKLIMPLDPSKYSVTKGPCDESSGNQ